MKLVFIRSLIIIVPMFLLQSCAQEQEMATSSQQNTDSAELGFEERSLYSEFNIQMTIRDVMNTFIDPNADIIWEAVSYDASIDGGIIERMPETDEDWRLCATARLEL